MKTVEDERCCIYTIGSSKSLHLQWCQGGIRLLASTNRPTRSGFDSRFTRGLTGSDLDFKVLLLASATRATACSRLPLSSGVPPFGLWPLGLWPLACALWHVPFGLCPLACGLWPVAFGLWLLAFGLWPFWPVETLLVREFHTNLPPTLPRQTPRPSANNVHVSSHLDSQSLESHAGACETHYLLATHPTMSPRAWAQRATQQRTSAHRPWGRCW